MAAASDTAKYVNPLDDGSLDAQQTPGFDPTAAGGAVVKVTPVKALKMEKDNTFEDDKRNSPQYSPRTQQRVNAHHVQKFVGEQSTSHARACPAPPVLRTCTACLLSPQLFCGSSRRSSAVC